MPNFKAIRQYFCVLWQLSHLDKKKGKKRRNSANLRRFISWKCLVQFSWNLECKVMTLAGISTSKIVWFCWKCQSYVHMKIVLLFFLLITHGCGMPASWGIWHTTVCLDMYHYVYDICDLLNVMACLYGCCQVPRLYLLMWVIKCWHQLRWVVYHISLLMNL